MVKMPDSQQNVYRKLDHPTPHALKVALVKVGAFALAIGDTALVLAIIRLIQRKGIGNE
jgi:hypothetical protein